MLEFLPELVEQAVEDMAVMEEPMAAVPSQAVAAEEDMAQKAGLPP